MMKPHTCPKCSGERVIELPAAGKVYKRVCPTCKGTGVVWEQVSDVKQAIDLGGTDRAEK